ncbi:TPA: hypothetical protein IAC10_00315 [Candidatus Scatousia excrementigallinarum]|uniref:Uncharacterized protein n=1 Tax=Candidatus Scatousia excrementigallinarum TaxID=2840935 RepID=A0A9D1JLL2_9BACT|nr:hypothetical protein [Candidatus Scatousia excrementigallinarum]
MDKEKLKLFKNALAIIGLLIFVVIYLLVMRIAPSIQTISQTASEYKTQSDLLAEKERLLDTKKQAVLKATDTNLNGTKDMYKPLESGLDAEGVVAAQFDDILKMLKANAIKTRSIKYDYNPADDPFVKGAGDKLSACTLDMQMVATYKNFEGFIKDLYKHEHFLDISKVEIIPYEKNKTLLLINFKLKLYAKKV